MLLLLQAGSHSFAVFAKSLAELRQTATCILGRLIPVGRELVFVRSDNPTAVVADEDSFLKATAHASDDVPCTFVVEHGPGGKVAAVRQINVTEQEETAYTSRGKSAPSRQETYTYEQPSASPAPPPQNQPQRESESVTNCNENDEQVRSAKRIVAVDDTHQRRVQAAADAAEEARRQKIIRDDQNRLAQEAEAQRLAQQLAEQEQQRKRKEELASIRAAGQAAKAPAQHAAPGITADEPPVASVTPMLARHVSTSHPGISVEGHDLAVRESLARAAAIAKSLDPSPCPQPLEADPRAGRGGENAAGGRRAEAAQQVASFSSLLKCRAFVDYRIMVLTVISAPHDGYLQFYALKPTGREPLNTNDEFLSFVKYLDGAKTQPDQIVVEWAWQQLGAASPVRGNKQPESVPSSTALQPPNSRPVLEVESMPLRTTRYLRCRHSRLGTIYHIPFLVEYPPSYWLLVQQCAHYFDIPEMFIQLHFTCDSVGTVLAVVSDSDVVGVAGLSLQPNATMHIVDTRL